MTRQDYLVAKRVYNEFLIHVKERGYQCIKDGDFELWLEEERVKDEKKSAFEKTGEVAVGQSAGNSMSGASGDECQ